MRRGLDWYKREPRAFLDGVRQARLTDRQAAVYAVVLDLIYDGGGETPNDPGYIAAHFSNVGKAAVRKTIAELVEVGKLIVEGDMLTQKRAQNEAKTKRNLSETRAETGRKGGINSGKRRRELSENKDLAEATASSKTEAEKEKRREDNPLTPLEGEVGRAYELWNELTAEYPSLPKAVNKDGPTRKRLIARLKAEGLSGFEKALQGIRASPHHRNEGNWNGMNFAWLVNATNFEKLQMLAGAPKANGTQREETATERALRRAREIEREGSSNPEPTFQLAGGMR